MHTKHKYSRYCWLQRNKSNLFHLGDLLKEFFGFYGDVNLKDNGISVISGSLVSKGEHADAHLHLVNPLEPELNAGRIVADHKLDIFQTKCRQALEHLNESTDRTGRKNHDSEMWGLVGLCTTESEALANSKHTEWETTNGESTFESENEHSEPATIPRVKIADLFKTLEAERDDSSQGVTKQTSSQVLKTT